MIVALYASVYPVAVRSWGELPPAGGNWIALDWRGMEVAERLILVGLAATVVLVHLAVTKYSRRFSFWLVVGCAALPAMLVPIGTSVNGGHIRREDERRAREKDTHRRALLAEIGAHVRVRWHVEVEPSSPALFVVEIASDMDLNVHDVEVEGSARRDVLPEFHGEYDEPFAVRARRPKRVDVPLDATPPAGAVWGVRVQMNASGRDVFVEWNAPGFGLDPDSLKLPPASPDLPVFAPLGPGVGVHRAYRIDPTRPKVTWIVVRVEPALTPVRAVRVPGDRLEALGREPSSPFAVNAGFFAPDLSPSGLVVADGVVEHRYARGAGSGVLIVERGLARIEPAAPVEPAGISLAVQCGPRLVEPGGVNGMVRDDGKEAARTVACVRRGGRELDFVLAYYASTPSGGPTLFETAKWLLAPIAPGDTDGCEAALNLDGGPSTGLVGAAIDEREWRLPVGPVPWAIGATR